MSKRKKFILQLSAIALVLAITFVMAFFVIPAQDYDPDLYRLARSCGEEYCDCTVYSGKQYFMYYLDYHRYWLCIDKTKVDLEIISWQFGFPFRDIMSISSYSKESPDYIVGNYVDTVSYAGDLEDEIFYIEGIDEKFTLPELYENSYPIDLYLKNYTDEFTMTLSAHPELFLNVTIFIHNTEYYISFDRGGHAYKISADFLSFLKEKSIIG